MAQSHLQPPRGLSVVVAVLAARRAQELAPGIPWWLLWRFRRSPGRAGRLLWGFLGYNIATEPKQLRIVKGGSLPQVDWWMANIRVSEVVSMQFAGAALHMMIAYPRSETVRKIIIFLEALPRAPLNSSIVLHFLPALDPLPMSDNLEVVF